MTCIKLNSLIDHSPRNTPEQKSCNVKDGEKKNLGSVPLIPILYSGVQSGLRPILHPSLVEILPVVSVLFCSQTKQHLDMGENIKSMAGVLVLLIADFNTVDELIYSFHTALYLETLSVS